MKNAEYKVEKEFMEHMVLQGFENTTLRDYEDIKKNFKNQIEKFNAGRLVDAKGIPMLSDAEFRRLMTRIESMTVMQTAELWRSQDILELDNGKTMYLRFVSKKPGENIYQISQQIVMDKKDGALRKNRYDVTLLINGLPIVQVELKRSAVDFNEAINQVNRYRKVSFRGLFTFLQLFVVSNETVTKYFCNQNMLKNGYFNKIENSAAFYWLDEKNERIINLEDFADAVLNKDFLTELLLEYMILKKEEKQMIVMRPYQIYEVKAAVKRVVEDKSNGYIFACTGSGKTLTSFKLAKRLGETPDIEIVFFLIDRRDLDDQTVAEYNSFEPGCVDYTENIGSLVKQLKNGNTTIVTTMQKMNRLLNSDKKDIQKFIKKYLDKHVVFIIDECHRSQFGKMNTEVKRCFKNANFIGFTGTPIYEVNCGSTKQTTADIFEPKPGLHACMHAYMMKDAIADKNVLPFQVEYIKTVSDEVEEMARQGKDVSGYYHEENRMMVIVDDIFDHHGAKRHPQGRNGADWYSALFGVDSVRSAVAYYKLFEAKNQSLPEDKRLNFAVIFTPQENKDEDNQVGSDALGECMEIYNKTYGTSFTPKEFDAYRKDVSNRLKFDSGKHIDVLIVVNMFLTGFDAKRVNTLFLDKNLQYHSLVQAYSRTNRTYKSTKRCGNIVTYRNIKKEQDEALALFSGDGDPNACLKEDFEAYLKEWREKVSALHSIASSPEDAAMMKSDEEKAAFVRAFRDVMRVLKSMELYTAFEWDNMKDLTKPDYDKYEGVYRSIRNRMVEPGGEESELAGIDFEVELIGIDRVNFDYIMRLLAKSSREEAFDEVLARKLAEYDDGISKELIKRFVKECFPKLPEHMDAEDMMAAFFEFKKDLEKEEVKKFAAAVGVEVSIVSGILDECRRSGEALSSICGHIMKHVKGRFPDKVKAKNQMIEMAKKYV